MTDVKQKVTDSVNKSGYPLELFVFSKLDERFIPSANQYYFDYDENKARSIDVVAENATDFLKGVTGHKALSVDLVIECKKSVSHAWVFYKLPTFLDGQALGQVVDFWQVAKGDLNEETLLWEVNGASPVLHYGENMDFSAIAHSYSTVRIGEKEGESQSGKSKDEIFEAVNQVVKFVTYSIKQEFDTLREHYMRRKVDVDFRLFYPIIVFDGHLYEGSLKDEKIELAELDHIVLQYNYQPKYLSTPKTFLIDVVRKQYFEHFIDEILKDDAKELVAKIHDNYKKYEALVDELDRELEVNERDTL